MFCFFYLNVPLNYLMCPVFTVGPLPETVVEAVEKVAAPFFKFFFLWNKTGSF